MTEITSDSISDDTCAAEQYPASEDTGSEQRVSPVDEAAGISLPEPLDTFCAAEEITDSTSMIDLGDGSVALRVMDPHRAGTIMVAVADPSESYCDQAPFALDEDFQARQDSSLQHGLESSPLSLTCDNAIPQYGDLVEVAAVRLDGLGPALFFTTNGVACAVGASVVVSVEEGLAFGEVASVMQVNPEHLEGMGDEDRKICPIAYAATEKDIVAAQNNRVLATEALAYCQECIGVRNLDMKLVDVLVLHDRSKMIFYFTAPARIDFRELVKDLVRRYRTRIELRQIGVRHETQMVGALGNCGMVCCCRRYLRKFAPVAIKMAKEQNVFLNPVKISGICGRLLCCLAYEQGHYDEFYRSCPKLGKKYQTDAGVMRVLRASLFRESVTVLSDAGEEVEYSLADWEKLNPFRPNASQQQPQHSHKPEHQNGEGKPRKNGGRNGQPPVQANRQERRGPFPKDPAAETAGGYTKECRGEDPFSRIEEEPILTEDLNSVPLGRAETLSGIAADDPDEFDDICDIADNAGDGESIFGLAPAKGNEGAVARNDQRDGSRHRRPRRRKPRSE